jgi:hypothetical protein
LGRRGRPKSKKSKPLRLEVPTGMDGIIIYFLKKFQKIMIQ